MKKVLSTLSVLVTVSVLGACNNMDALSTNANSTFKLADPNGNVTATNTALKTQATDATNTSNANAGQKQGHQGKPDGKGGGHEGFGGGFLDRQILDVLALTDAQKAELKKIDDEERASMPAKPTVDTTKVNPQELIKTAFLADTFDKAGLQAKLDASKPVKVDMSVIHAQNLIKRYNVLTAEQKAKLDTEIAARDTKMSSMPAPQAPIAPTDAQKTARLDKLATDLGLDANQKTALSAILASEQPPARPDFATMIAKQKANRDAIFAELKSTSPSADKIASLINTNKPEMVNNESTKLDNLAKIHDLLNADKRSKFINGMGAGKGDGHKGGFAGGPRGGDFNK